jgi:hypothetical protein
MQIKHSVVSAIAAAVQMYIETQQQDTAPAAEARPYRPPAPSSSPWLIGGRQAAMELRRMWQMRLAR